MSRFFDPAVADASQVIITPDASIYNSLTAITLAAWVKIAAYGEGEGGAPVILKDPTSYLTYLLINADGTLYGEAGGKATTTPAQAVSVVNGGTGYGPNDLGTMNGGTGTKPIYHVFGETLGVCTGVGLDTFGSGGFQIGQICTTQKTTGAGNNNLTLQVTQLFDVWAISVSNEIIPLNTWTHISMTWSTVDGTVRLYINGVEVTYASQTISEDIDTSTGGFYIGNDGFGDIAELDIAEAVVYDSALSGPAVLALAESTDGATGSPIGYWHLCGDDSPEPDSSGNGNDAVLSVPPPVQGEDSPGWSCQTGATEITEVVVNNDQSVERNSPFDVVVAVDAPVSQDTEIELTFTGTGNLTGILTATILTGETEVTFTDLEIDSVGTDDYITAQVISGDPVTGLDSDLFDVTDSTVSTHDSVGIGEFGGSTLAEAFYNPQRMDLVQVINEGGDVVWNLTFNGVASVNPVSPTTRALIGSYFGESFVLAFPNPYSKDVLQVIGQGDNVVFWVDATGISHTA